MNQPVGAALKPRSKRRPRLGAGPSDYSADTLVAGKYRLLYPLGEGGMGSVWAAYSSALDINVALKLIHLDIAHEEAPLRLVQEARATARLADPGIVRMFDVGQTDRGDPYIAMELLTGNTLLQTLDAGPLPPVRAVRLLLPIVRALETAHRAGVVHRDVKPDNILFAVGARGDLQPKLVDFGVAKLLTSQNQLTHVGAVVGSPQYMSPEQARGEAIDHRTDLWSLCVVLYEATVGAPPFIAANTHALLHGISTSQFEWSAQQAAPDPSLAEIIRKGLANDREARWQHARDLMLALAEWLRLQGVTEDIAGVALRGRGLGQKSSLPGPPIEAGSGSQRRPMGTAVNIALPASAEVHDAAKPDSSSDAVALGAPAVSPAQASRHERRIWRAVVLALSVLGLLAGTALSRTWAGRSELEAHPLPSAANAAAAPALAPPSAAAKPSSAAAPTEPAAPTPPAAKPELAPASPPRDAEPPPRRAAEAAPPRKPAPRAKPAAQRPRAAPVPFKNPFD